MAGKFTGKVVLITGAASGIGRATALKLASQGATLSLCDINPAGLDTLAAELEGLSQPPPQQQQQVMTKVCDVGRSADCDAVVQSTLAQLLLQQSSSPSPPPSSGRRIDFVFNCAGVNPTALAIADTTDEYFDKLVNTNLRGPYNMTRAAAPHLGAGAAIVNVASTAGLRASAGYSIYCATKSGVIGFTKAMAMELGPRGVRVNCIAPGPVDTPTMASNVAGGGANERLVAGIALGRLGQPEDIADVVAFLFSDESRFMNGSVVEISGGMG